MNTVTKRVRARVRGQTLELLEDVLLPANDQEVTVNIEIPSEETTPVLQAIDECAGAWTAAAHPDLQTREDVVNAVRDLRLGLERTL